MFRDIRADITTDNGPDEVWWTPYADANDTTHYPQRRHSGVFNVLYCDGHVIGMAQNDLKDVLFYAR